MPDWWPFGKKEEKQEERSKYKQEDDAYEQSLATLRQGFEQQQANGVSRQAILKEVEAEATRLEGTATSPQQKGKLRAYDVIYSELRNALMQNLQAGRSLEMTGRVEEAIAHYETAVADQMSTRFPYEHLRVIYRRQERYDEALRVCRAALENPFLSEKDYAHFRTWAERFENHAA